MPRGPLLSKKLPYRQKIQVERFGWVVFVCVLTAKIYLIMSMNNMNEEVSYYMILYKSYVKLKPSVCVSFTKH